MTALLKVVQRKIQEKGSVDISGIFAKANSLPYPEKAKRYLAGINKKAWCTELELAGRKKVLNTLNRFLMAKKETILKNSSH